MEEHKFYVIRIKAIESSTEFSEPDDLDETEYDTTEYVLEHGASVASNISENIADIIGSRGEYLGWVELNSDEIYAEEWVIYDEDCLDELQMQDFGLEDVEVIIEESLNKWGKIHGEWQMVFDD